MRQRIESAVFTAVVAGILLAGALALRLEVVRFHAQQEIAGLR